MTRKRPLTYLPFWPGSIVELEKRRYLISELQLYHGAPDYSIVGHSKLNSRGYGQAWIDHCDLVLIQNPTPQTVFWLAQTQDEDSREYAT